jgi:uncharacterized protein
MELLLLLLGIVFLFLGLLGAFLPIPGPPLSFLGIFCLKYTHYFKFDTYTLTILAIITVGLVFLDYYIPILGAKKFGGTKWGINGVTVGLIIGLFFGPLGIIFGPFIGAYIGEIINKNDHKQAFKSAIGSFLGFITGIILKISICIYMIYYTIINYNY